MFSPWIFKKRIFGIDINIEFDFYGPIFKTWQKIYEFKLKRIWSNNNGPNFMKFALKHLPNGSFIVFHFDETGNEFMQFMKSGTRIISDIPIWETNVFFNKKKDLMEILKKFGIKKGAIYNIRQGKSNVDLRVDFGNHNAVACGVAIKICEDIFGIKEPNLVNYETYALIQKKSKSRSE